MLETILAQIISDFRRKSFGLEVGIWPLNSALMWGKLNEILALRWNLTNKLKSLNVQRVAQSGGNVWFWIDRFFMPIVLHLTVTFSYLGVVMKCLSWELAQTEKGQLFFCLALREGIYARIPDKMCWHMPLFEISPDNPKTIFPSPPSPGPLLCLLDVRRVRKKETYACKQ